MATTYELIASQILSATTGTVTFSSIPGTYDDLCILVSARSDRSGQTFSDYNMRFNSDSGTNYDFRRLRGNGSSASSSSFTGISQMYCGITPATNATASTFTNDEIYIPNYAGSSNKSVSITNTAETNATAAVIYPIAGIWNDTSAISTIELLDTLGNFVSGSSFYLYGITKA